MIVWIGVSLVIPIGLIVGPLNARFEQRRKQSFILLSVGILSGILWIVHFFGH